MLSYNWTFQYHVFNAVSVRISINELWLMYWMLWLNIFISMNYDCCVMDCMNDYLFSVMPNKLYKLYSLHYFCKSYLNWPLAYKIKKLETLINKFKIISNTRTKWSCKDSRAEWNLALFCPVWQLCPRCLLLISNRGDRIGQKWVKMRRNMLNLELSKKKSHLGPIWPNLDANCDIPEP